MAALRQRSLRSAARQRRRERADLIGEVGSPVRLDLRVQIGAAEHTAAKAQKSVYAGQRDAGGAIAASEDEARSVGGEVDAAHCAGAILQRQDPRLPCMSQIRAL